MNRLGEGAGALLVLCLRFGLGISLRGMLGVRLAMLGVWEMAALAVRSGVAHRERPAAAALQPGSSARPLELSRE